FGPRVTPATCHVAARMPPAVILPTVCGFAPDTRTSPGGRVSVTETACAASPPTSVTFAVTVNGAPISIAGGPETAAVREGAAAPTAPGGRTIAECSRVTPE